MVQKICNFVRGLVRWSGDDVNFANFKKTEIGRLGQSDIFGGSFSKGTMVWNIFFSFLQFSQFLFFVPLYPLQKMPQIVWKNLRYTFHDDVHPSTKFHDFVFIFANFVSERILDIFSGKILWTKNIRNLRKKTEKYFRHLSLLRMTSNVWKNFEIYFFSKFLPRKCADYLPTACLERAVRKWSAVVSAQNARENVFQNFIVLTGLFSKDTTVWIFF